MKELDDIVNYTEQMDKSRSAPRDDYLRTARTNARRGMDLPWSKLTPLEVDAIRSAARQRDNLRKHIRDNLSNAALARAFGVHQRTVEKVLQGYTWGHV